MFTPGNKSFDVLMEFPTAADHDDSVPFLLALRTDYLMVKGYFYSDDQPPSSPAIAIADAINHQPAYGTYI